MSAQEISPEDIDFIGIGAAKSGTTWVYEMLKQHPQVFLPYHKEIHYFNRTFTEKPELDNYNFDKPLSWYLDFFKDARPDQVIGEITPTYIWDEAAAQRIHEFNPDVKILAVLREPVDRLYSYYLFLIQRGVLGNISIDEALVQRPDLLMRNQYYTLLKRYYDLFPRQNIKVMLYDDLRADNKEFLLEIERFLGVADFIPENYNQRTMITGDPRFKLFNRLIFKARTFLRKYDLKFVLDFLRFTRLSYLLEDIRTYQTKPWKEKPHLDKRKQAELKAYFREEVDNLEKLIGRDLSVWKHLDV
jgi:hypothetical protein